MIHTIRGDSSLVWRTGERRGFPGGEHSTFIAVCPKTQRNVYENSCWPGQVGTQRAHSRWLFSKPICQSFAPTAP